MQAAFLARTLALPPPAAGARILAGLHRSRARLASDRGITAVVQRVVEELDMIPQVEVAVQLMIELLVPVIFMAEENARLRLDLCALERRAELLQFMANLFDFEIGSVFTASIMRQDSAIKLL